MRRPRLPLAQFPLLLASLLALFADPLLPAAPAQVVINEFLASNNRSIADEDGDRPDWIELFNAGTTSVNLDGWFLTDDAADRRKWRFPAVTLAPKGFLVVFASGKSRSDPAGRLHTNFSLDANGEYLALVRADGTTIATEFAPEFPSQRPDISYGTSQLVTTNTLLARGSAARTLVPTSGSLGGTWTAPGFNDTSWTAGRTGVGYESAVPGFAVRNVKANTTVSDLATAKTLLADPTKHLRSVSENAATINYFGSGGDGHYGGNRGFPGAPAGADEEDFIVEITGTLTLPAAGAWTFGVNSDDGFELSVGSFNLNFPSPRGPADTLGVFNAPSAGEYEVRLLFYERGGGSEVEFFAARGSFTAWDAANFRLVGDTAAGGLAVRSQPVAGGAAQGSFRPHLATDVQAAMQNRNASAYVRVPFQVANPATLRSLTLRMMYDDGYVAYLNGQEVARRNAPASVSWNSAASAARAKSAALEFEDVALSDRLGLVVAGANVLAIQGLSEGPADSDFLVMPELVEYLIQSQAAQYFATATPGAPNAAGFVAFVADTKFSHDRGFHNAPFDLRITCETPDVTIRYTTNGTPPSLTNGLVYTAPLRIAATTVLRAAAFRDGYQPSNVDTHTYLFLDDVIRQSPTGQPPPGWPATWGSNVRDYGMDPDVVNNAAYSGTIKNDLLTVPSFSIVTDLKNLFDPTTGIYANPGQDGADWERPCSLELIHPDGAEGFQANAGIRIRGGFSRSTSNPKHAFRFFFREEYGDAKLRYPLFGDAGTDTFDGIDLRTFQNYSWSFQGDANGIFLRDQFSRDTQIAMGHQGERGDYYHLYINGQYWGLFNTCERPEASYGATYYGGNREDYDVIKVEAGPYTINATDGTMDAWTRLYNAAKAGFTSNEAYMRVQGRNPDGTPNPAYENLVDVPNLIDYMLVILYGGNLDAPISNFLGNTSPNNWFGLRNRLGVSGGFKFFVHDAEHTLLDLNRDRTGPYSAGESSITKSNPQWIWQKLQANAEFRVLVADHVHRHFFNGGVLTPESCRARFLARKDEIDRAVVGESARWGDAKTATPLTRNQHWLNAINNILNNHLPRRSQIVLDQLKADQLYPAVVAPSFSQHGGNVPPGYALAITAPAGTVYYTLDGSDPRLLGGSVSPRARAYSQPVALTENASVRSRVFSGSGWSALNEAPFTLIQTYTELRITEIMYHPPAEANRDGDDFEFIELKNIATRELDLSGVRFTNGVYYTFPNGTRLAPGAFVVLAANPAALTNKYPGLRVFGTYEGRLANGGETLTLVHAAGTLLSRVSFSDQAPWPALADGLGFSLVPVNPNTVIDPDNPAQWRASSRAGGSPGADDTPAGLLPVWITEINTHTDPPQVDAIEVFNPNPVAVDIGHWYLSDDLATPKKYRIPAGTVLQPSQHQVFTENQFNPNPGVPPSFNLSSHGESVYLFSADATGNLTGFSDGFSFDAAANGVSFGRHTTSDGQVLYPAQTRLTFGSPNSGPRVGPVVINEIHYAPTGGAAEFLELKNITGGSVKLFDPAYPTNRWRIDGIDFTFPQGFELAGNSLLLVVGSDPAAFRARHQVPASVPILGPFTGQLQDNGENLRLLQPDAPDLVTNANLVSVFIPFIVVDEVRYNNRAPWPTNAAGFGPSLERVTSGAFGNDPANWRSSFNVPSPGLENSGNRAPVLNAGADLTLQTPSLPASTSLAASVQDDGQPNPPGRVTLAWSKISGPGNVTFTTPTQAATTASFDRAGTYVLQISASDGALPALDEITVTVELQPVTLNLVAAGAVWKYLDDGSDQGTAWRAANFADSTWKSGPAQLGYGDGDEATVISFGANSAAKFPTTYFRRTFQVAQPGVIKQLKVRLLRDDGAIVYLNGVEVFRSNMPEGDVAFNTFASNVVGGADESAFLEQLVDSTTLVQGANTIAVEVHQNVGNSTDLSFELELIAEAVPSIENQPPTVSAGADLVVTLPAAASLDGTVGDDGQPNPPGRTTNLWTHVSGPGAVTFDNATAVDTVARFSAAGVHVLRLTAGDGAFTSADDTTVVVRLDDYTVWQGQYFDLAELLNPAISGKGADPDSDRHTNYEEFLAGTLPKDAVSVLRFTQVTWGKGGTTLRFQAMANKSYTIQFRTQVATGNWSRLVDVPAEPSTRTVEVQDPAAATSAPRFYRLITPQQ